MALHPLPLLRIGDPALVLPLVHAGLEVGGQRGPGIEALAQLSPRASTHGAEMAAPRRSAAPGSRTAQHGTGGEGQLGGGSAGSTIPAPTQSTLIAQSIGLALIANTPWITINPMSPSMLTSTGLF